MRILGIDPGLRRTGFGVIDVQGAHLSYVASGTIAVPTEQNLAPRLRDIYQHIEEVIRLHQPTVAAVEIIFFNTNPASTLLLGHARGAALSSLACQNLTVHEYTALQIKKSVVGAGRASKEQVQLMVQRLLRLNGTPSPDAADALACAICHAHTSPLQSKLQQGQTHLGTHGQARFKAGRLIR